MQQSLQVGLFKTYWTAFAFWNVVVNYVSMNYEVNHRTGFMFPDFRYYVGLLNKQTMQMEIHNAELFNMQPFIPGKHIKIETDFTSGTKH